MFTAPVSAQKASAHVVFPEAGKPRVMCSVGIGGEGT
jgi:hypothetical protein